MLSYSIRVLACITIVSGIFCVVWLRSSIRSVEYELGSLERELGGALRENKSLLAERAEMLSIHAFGEKAGGSMGLGFPDRQKVFYVKRDRGDIPYEASFRRER